MSQYEYEKNEESFHKERRRKLENETNLKKERLKRQTNPVNNDEPPRK